MNIAVSLIRWCCFCLMLAVLLLPVPEDGRRTRSSSRPAPSITCRAGTSRQFKWVEADYELDAYYSNVSLTIALTKDPIPSLGEQEEDEIYVS